MKRGEPPRRTKRLQSDPTKVRAWQDRTRKPIARRSAKRIAEDARTADLRASVAALPCLLAAGAPIEVSPGNFVAIPVCAGPGTPHHLEKAWRQNNTVAWNLVPLCAGHNRWCEDFPPLAQLLGLVVNDRIDRDEALRRRIAAGLVPAYYALDDHPDQEEPAP